MEFVGAVALVALTVGFVLVFPAWPSILIGTTLLAVVLLLAVKEL